MPENNLQKNIDENFGGILSPKPEAPKTPTSPVIPGTADSQSRRLKSLRTFQGDVEEAITRTKASTVSIAVAEQKRKIEIEKNEKKVEPEKQSRNDNLKNRFYIYLGSAMLVLAVALIITIYENYKNKSNAPEKIVQTNTIIRYTTGKNLDISRVNSATFSDNILQEKKNFNQPVNSVLYLNIKKDGSTASISDVLSMLVPNLPSELSRSLSDKYMFGIYSFDTNEPFIILTDNDYGLAYSGMLKWENTISTDLGKIFSLTSSTTRIFNDESIRNKDLRIIKNDVGKTVLVYSFIDKNTILITTNESIFNAILAKYITSELVR